MFTPFSIDSFMIASWALRVAHLLQYESIAERNNVYYFYSPRPRALPMGVVKRPLPSERVVERGWVRRTFNQWFVRMEKSRLLEL